VRRLLVLVLGERPQLEIYQWVWGLLLRPSARHASTDTLLEASRGARCNVKLPHEGIYSSRGLPQWDGNLGVPEHPRIPTQSAISITLQVMLAAVEGAISRG
jgi:hypothetical protein